MPGSIDAARGSITPPTFPSEARQGATAVLPQRTYVGNPPAVECYVLQRGAGQDRFFFVRGDTLKAAYGQRADSQGKGELFDIKLGRVFDVTDGSLEIQSPIGDFKRTPRGNVEFTMPKNRFRELPYELREAGGQIYLRRLEMTGAEQEAFLEAANIKQAPNSPSLFGPYFHSDTFGN